MKKMLVLLLLTGCSQDFWFGKQFTPEQKAQAIVERLSPHCEAIGYQRGTDQWRQCIQRMYALATQENAARIQSEGRQTYCQRFSNGDIICQ